MKYHKLITNTMAEKVQAAWNHPHVHTVQELGCARNTDDRWRLALGVIVNDLLETCAQAVEQQEMIKPKNKRQTVAEGFAWMEAKQDAAAVIRSMKSDVWE